MTSGPDPITKGSDPLGRLLQLSSPSPPSPAAVARARRTIEREWVGVVRRRRRVAWILVVAAALVCALALGLVLDVLESSIETVAELTVTSGGVTVTTPTGAPDQAASMLGAGTLIETGRDGRAALSLATGVDLLLDSSSHLPASPMAAPFTDRSTPNTG